MAKHDKARYSASKKEKDDLDDALVFSATRHRQIWDIINRNTYPDPSSATKDLAAFSRVCAGQVHLGLRGADDRPGGDTQGSTSGVRRMWNAAGAREGGSESLMARMPDVITPPERHEIPDYGLMEEYIRIIEVCGPLVNAQSNGDNAILRGKARSLVGVAMDRLKELIK
jgi:hypothetical protein